MSREMTPKDVPPVTRVICPACGAELRPTDATCEQCGRVAGRPAATDSRGQLKQLINRPWVIVLLMLHVGLLGIPVYWKTNYSLGVRIGMVIASIVYTLGAVTFIVVMLQWLVRVVTGG